LKKQQKKSWSKETGASKEADRSTNNNSGLKDAHRNSQAVLQRAPVSCFFPGSLGVELDNLSVLVSAQKTTEVTSIQ
jgi:hypothetical protein